MINVITYVLTFYKFSLIFINMRSRQKSETIQIRVSKAEKEKLKKLSQVHKMCVSEFILSNLLTDISAYEVRQLYELIAKGENRVLSLFNLRNKLKKISPAFWDGAVGIVPDFLDPFSLAYVASTIEELSYIRGLSYPEWCTGIKALSEPYIGSDQETMNFYILVNSPVPFKRRNIFLGYMGEEQI